MEVFSSVIQQYFSIGLKSYKTLFNFTDTTISKINC